MSQPTIKYTSLSERITPGPMMEPRPGIDWEQGGVMAPAVAKLGPTYYMVYRAFGADKISRLGLATSDDGLVWQRFDKPWAEPTSGDDQESYGMEDPRVAQIGSSYYITYTAATGHQEADGWHWSTRIHILKTDDFNSYERIIPQLPPADNKDAALFPTKLDGDYLLLHRYMPDIWLARSSDLVKWDGIADIVDPGILPWEDLRIGAGAPPMLCDLGWLLFYHGVSEDLVYSISALVLDSAQPQKMLYRLEGPILTPETEYETKGAVANVTFVTSALDMGDHYRLYYGGADSVIAACTVDKAKLLSLLRTSPII